MPAAAEPLLEKEAPQRHATILVVEDRPEVAEVLRRTLVGQGYEVRIASDGDAGLALALAIEPDLVLLDVMLPKQNGFAVARELRRRAFRAPVLMLTARDAVHDRVSGLEAGADDYLPKPFDHDELLARVRALLRRASRTSDGVVLKVGPVTLDRLAREVWRDGERIALTQREFALLEYLMRSAGTPVSREMICEHVWKTGFDPSTNIVDVYVTYLRRKLDAEGAPSLIQTVRGVGYVMHD